MNFLEYTDLNYEEQLNVFMNSLSVTNKTPEYFINWEKVHSNTKKYELHLTTMNYLIGKDNIRAEAIKLFSDQPKLLQAIPSLIASRDSSSDFIIKEDSEMIVKNLDFENIDENRIDEYIRFMEDTGLLDFIQNKIRMSLVDYVYGVEAGLDSNGRKNRSGTAMENIVESFIVDTSEYVNIEYLSQASAKAIATKWGVTVPVDKSNRRFDFAVYNLENGTLFLVETNYYNGGGSKLKAVAGEFATLNNLISTSEDKIQFIWVTDGQGWNTARIPLLEAFEEIEYIFNIDMLSNNFLKKIFVL